MAYFKVRVWKSDEIIAIARSKGEFIVDRNMYRFSGLRKKLRKMAKDASIPLKFNNINDWHHVVIALPVSDILFIMDSNYKEYNQNVV